MQEENPKDDKTDAADQEKNVVETSSSDTVSVSVRSLVEFLLREGDIDESTGSPDSVRAMQAGSRIHRKIQRRAGATYHAEVPLSCRRSFGRYDLLLSGRADGIIYDDVKLLQFETEGASIPSVTIDEIKGTYSDPLLMKEPAAVHLAQAKCYAFLFAEDHQLPQISVTMTYVNLDSEEQKQFSFSFQRQELSDWFERLLEDYRKWSDFSYFQKHKCRASAAQLSFPFSYRPGQKELVRKIYYSVSNGHTLFLQAATGVGKTIATIYPSVIALGEGKAQRIFYLTAKTLTRTVARDTFQILGEEGYLGMTCEITARERQCPLAVRSCNPKDCERAKGHFDRINEALYDLITSEHMITRQTVEDYAQKYRVCPYELNLDAAVFCDHIICDYNYVFDPNVCLKRFFAEGTRSEAIFLIDEAHNLVERGREMYSETLCKETFLEMKRRFRGEKNKITPALERCNRILLSYKKKCDGILYLDEIDELIFALMHLSSEFEKYFDRHRGERNDPELLDFYFTIRNFLNLTEEFDGHVRIYCDFSEDGRFLLHFFCVDPSAFLQKKLSSANAAVFFSATLLPMSYYRDLLCTEQKPYALYAKSPFDPAHRLTFIENDLTSRYRDRSREQYLAYAKSILQITSQKNGNYMIFFPSYAFLSEVETLLCDLADERFEIASQSPDMSEESRDAFLGSFSGGHDGIYLALCVAGGAFSEGIDLTGERLIGALICGMSLPGFSHRQQVLSDYFSNCQKSGFDHAYLYPGMNKVLQAAGRVIRTEEDKGIVVLLDSRFAQNSCRAIFPEEWGRVEAGSGRDVTEAVRFFWENQ